jgi:hypothetical protein
MVTTIETPDSNGARKLITVPELLLPGANKNNQVKLFQAGRRDKWTTDPNSPVSRGFGFGQPQPKPVQIVFDASQG